MRILRMLSIILILVIHAGLIYDVALKAEKEAQKVPEPESTPQTQTHPHLPRDYFNNLYPTFSTGGEFDGA